jgi:hypothetical protein
VRLHVKKNRLDLINARLCAECADRKKLTLAELNTFISGEKRVPEEVHDAIMSATHVLVTENGPDPKSWPSLATSWSVFALIQIPEKSGLPSCIRGAGAAISTEPSGLRGTPFVGLSSHCAAKGFAASEEPSTIKAAASRARRCEWRKAGRNKLSIGTPRVAITCDVDEIRPQRVARSRPLQ